MKPIKGGLRAAFSAACKARICTGASIKEGLEQVKYEEHIRPEREQSAVCKCPVRLLFESSCLSVQ